jgi:glycosyltransferase involved in cell wall biosynthesis
VYGPANVWWYRTSHEYFLRRALRRRLAEEGSCVVYAQCPVSARAALAARVGPHQRVVLAVHFRISQADEWADKGQIPRDGRVYTWIRDTERQVLPRVDGLVFVSSWARSAVRAWMPEVDLVPGAVVHNFVNVPAVGAAAASPGHLVSVGNLEAVKNHRFLVRVLAAARDKGYTYRLDVFGEGVERTRLLALADELGLSEQVRLHGFCSDVQQRLPGYAAYVHASYSESSSLAIMEAMAVALPVVSSRDGALTELFDDPEEGRFWPTDDPVEAARILIDLMESPEELRRAGAAAQARFLRDYDADVVVPRLLQFLQVTSPTA